MHIQFARGPEQGPTWGPALLRSESGELYPNPDSFARTCGIETLLATKPWMDSVDLEMFLNGFDAGESYARRNADTEQRTPQS